MDASHIRGLMRNNHTQGNGELATDLFVSAFTQAIVDSFSTKTNVVMNSNDITLYSNRVSVFDTSFGTLKLHVHRYAEVSSDATGRLIALRPEKFAVAMLEEPFLQTELGPTGGFVERALRTSLTLEAHNKLVHWYSDGFDKD